MRRLIVVFVATILALEVCAVPGARAETPVVGLVVPLSGRWEAVGQKILRGVMCASGVFGGEGLGIEFVVKDYGDDMGKLASIVDGLASDDRVLAVIGPVGEKAVEVACSHATPAGLPVISFTQAEPAGSKGTVCFRNFLTVETQAHALLAAAASLGVTRFAVFGPDDQFGKTLAHHFTRLAPTYGVRVLAARTYPPTHPDFQLELRELFKGMGEGARQVQALLVPDEAANAGMIASYLAYLKRQGIRLFGPSLWDSPDLMRAGGANVEGAVFLSGFFPHGYSSAARDFAEAFRPYGANPGVWEASAYDTARIVSNILQEGVRSRKGVAARLASVRRYDGASGLTSLFPDGSLEKQPRVLSVRGGAVVEIFP
ncbi:MAG TPA: penicillin-binding protein activator [Deltaproteobacteria bacterium]|nr:penicillin-binding protein activator [Deltaproteobacteria bacterium]HOM28350.1 penicillin-binding protein activator [Deltaproteobacteria bacterium]HPP81742.1 penicillin-binding protein activator [Deltaproteobacteria bacterium]